MTIRQTISALKLKCHSSKSAEPGNLQNSQCLLELLILTSAPCQAY